MFGIPVSVLGQAVSPDPFLPSPPPFRTWWLSVRGKGLGTRLGVPYATSQHPAAIDLPLNRGLKPNPMVEVLQQSWSEGYQIRPLYAIGCCRILCNSLACRGVELTHGGQRKGLVIGKFFHGLNQIACTTKKDSKNSWMTKLLVHVCNNYMHLPQPLHVFPKDFPVFLL